MALEISEIGISMRISDSEPGAPEDGGARATATPNAVDRDELVAECVRRVVELLRGSEER
ncbi:MAG: DUF5908 family protein [Acidobacteriota bacterium]